MLHSTLRKVIGQGGYPPLPEGITLRTKERRAMPMEVTFADLFQFCIFVVALIGLCFKVFKDKEK
jgi:hypothetical protein